MIAFMSVPLVGHADNNKGKGQKFSQNGRYNKSELVKSAYEDNDDDDNDDDDDDDDDKGKGNGNSNRDNKNKDRRCARAWGHYIATGWMKKNDRPQIIIPADCPIPSGIAKKIGWNGNGNGNGNGGSTSTPTTTPKDTVAPVISNLAGTSTAPHRAVITWKTNELSDTALWFGTSTSVSATGTPSIQNTRRTLDHRVVLSGLSASTTYYAVVRSMDKSGNSSTSGLISFTTRSLPPTGTTTPPTPQPQAPVLSNIVAIVGSTTVNVSWKTDLAASSELYYSTSTPVSPGSTSTQSVIAPALVTTHELSAIGLSTSTKYYFIVRSKAANNATSTTPEFSITTSSGY